MQLFDAANNYLNGFGDITLKTIERLLERGADATALNHHNETLVMMAANQSADHSNFNRHLPLLQLALRFGTNPNIPDHRNLPPLFWTIEYNCGERTLGPESRALIAAGANLNLTAEPTWEDAWKRDLKICIDGAQTRLTDFLSKSPPDVASLTTRDLCLFANLGHHHAAFTPDWWRGHEAHLEHLLTTCPI